MPQFRIIYGKPIECNKLLQINTLQQSVFIYIILFLKVVPSAVFFDIILHISKIYCTFAVDFGKMHFGCKILAAQSYYI